MLIKIGNAYVAPAEIAAATHWDATKLDPERFEVTLRSGEWVTVYCSAAEFEAALIDAGVIEDPTTDNLPELTEAELTKLGELHDSGYKYLARDADGKLYAYMSKPNLNGVSFYSSSFTEKATQVFEAFDFLGPCACFDITDALNGWTL